MTENDDRERPRTTTQATARGAFYTPDDEAYMPNRQRGLPQAGRSRQQTARQTVRERGQGHNTPPPKVRPPG